MNLCREQGLSVALTKACLHDTVCLPYIIAAFAALLFEPSRHVGIWIQIGELAFLCWTLWTYFTCVRRVAPVATLLALIPFLLLQCLYMNNGGLSDYRMDLSLMLLYGATCTWYLIASHSGRIGHFVMLGISCGAACLFRGTSPIYLVIALAPIVVWDLIFLRRNRSHLRGLVVAAAIATTLCLWFYVLNFEYLYYYYFIWNTDANAHLPLIQSMKHFEFVARHIGYPALTWLGLFQLVVLWARLQDAQYSLKRFRVCFYNDLRQMDLRPLWLGLIPALFLTLRGAGLNPFVCMPSVFGLCLFAVFPIPLRRGLNLSWQMSCVLLIAFGWTGFQVAREGWLNHIGDSPYSMTAHQHALDTILAHAKSQGRTKARFATSHIFYLNAKSLESVACFDRNDARFKSEGVAIQGVELFADHLMSLAAEADWQEVVGKTDEEKIDYLVDQAEQRLDYLVIPTPDCSVLLRDRVARNVLNRYAVTLREQLLASGNWQPISSEIRNRDDEIVQVFCNRNRFESSLSKAHKRRAERVALQLVARLQKHGKNPKFVDLGERLEKLKGRNEKGLDDGSEFLNEILKLARDLVAAEKKTDPVKEQNQAKAALTELFEETRTR